MDNEDKWRCPWPPAASRSTASSCRGPELRRLPAGQSVLPWEVGPDHWVLYSYDLATQAMRGHS